MPPLASGYSQSQGLQLLEAAIQAYGPLFTLARRFSTPHPARRRPPGMANSAPALRPLRPSGRALPGRSNLPARVFIGLISTPPNGTLFPGNSSASAVPCILEKLARLAGTAQYANTHGFSYHT
jgi:hypothetical protein